MNHHLLKFRDPLYLKNFIIERVNYYYPENNFKIKKIQKVKEEYYKKSLIKFIFSIHLIDGKSKLKKTIIIHACTDGSKRRISTFLNSLVQIKDLHQPPFQLPKPLEYIKEYEAIIYEGIEGDTLDIYLIKNGFSDQAKSYLNNIIDWLSVFQKLKLTDVKLEPISEIPYLKNNILIIKLISNQFYNQLTKIFKFIQQHQDLILENKLLVLAHGDFNLRNIIVNGKDNQIGFIDYEHLHYNHPVWDLAAFSCQSYLELKLLPLMKKSLSEKEVKKIVDYLLENWNKKNNNLLSKNREFFILSEIYFYSLALSHLIVTSGKNPKLLNYFEEIFSIIDNKILEFNNN